MMDTVTWTAGQLKFGRGGPGVSGSNAVRDCDYPDIISALVQCWINVVHYNGPWMAYNVGPV